MSESRLPETAPEKKRRFSWCKTSFFLLLVGLILGLCLLGYGYFHLAQINRTLANNVQTLTDQLQDQQQKVTSAKEAIDVLQAANDKNQQVATQQEQILSEWHAAQKGDLAKWHVAEAQYLVNLANDSLHFTPHLPLVAALLQRAQQILETLSDANVLALRKSLVNDMAALKSLPDVNVTTLYLRISTLDKQIDQLPLPTNPLKAETPEPIVADQPPTTWWRSGLDRSWQALQKIVIVRYNGSKALPLVLPEEKVFLYQNLHAQLEGSMWALLQRNPAIYQANLARAQQWVLTYFVKEASETQAFLSEIEALQKIDIASPAVNLSNTLQLFDDYFTQSKVSTVQ